MKIFRRAVVLVCVVLSATSVGWGDWTEPVKVGELDWKPIPIHADQPFLSADGLTMYFNRYVVVLGKPVILEAYRDTPDGVFTSERVLEELFDGDGFAKPWASNDQLRLYYVEGTASGNTLRKEGCEIAP